MSTYAPELLRAQYAASRGLGVKALSSDAYMVIDDFEYLSVLVKSFSFPVLASSGAAEAYLPGGQKEWVPQQFETALQSPFALYETQAGVAGAALQQIAQLGSGVGATVFEGRPERFSRAARIQVVVFQVDAPERDSESRSQVVTYNGQMYYHFTGEFLPGNIPGLGAIAGGALGAIRQRLGL